VERRRLPDEQDLPAQRLAAPAGRLRKGIPCPARPDHSPGPVETSGSRSKGPIQLPSKGPNQTPGKGSNQPPGGGPDQSKTTSEVDHGKAKDNTSLNKYAGSEAKTEPVSEVKQKQMQGPEPVSGQSQKKMENMAVQNI